MYQRGVAYPVDDGVILGRTLGYQFALIEIYALHNWSFGARCGEVYVKMLGHLALGFKQMAVESALIKRQ